MRAKPFSNKKKKIQLQERRKRKQENQNDSSENNPIKVDTIADLLESTPTSNKLMSQWEPKSFSKKESVFENPLYISPIESLPRNSLEVSFEDIHGDTNDFFTIPVRPRWEYEMTKEFLEENERLYFKNWLKNIYQRSDLNELSYFEHNIEVWRQLWRVCEISDIILIVVDARHPVLHFPPSLYHHVVHILGKQMVLALTKTDLVGNIVVHAWKNYIVSKFPGLTTVDVSIFDESDSLKRRYTSPYGIGRLLSTLREASPSAFDSEWSEVLNKRASGDFSAPSAVGLNIEEVLTIGLIGHPNAGKSSLINSIVGKKVVSTSKTAGHTKHYQTIHISKHIRLCDCPGLIFPMKVPKWLQILSGLYNVAQVRDPYLPIYHLAQLMNLQKVPGITSNTGSSVLDVCEGNWVAVVIVS